MIRISPSLRLSVGLAFFTASVLLLGDSLGLVPNRNEAMLDARKKVCESLAVQLSLAATRSEYALVRDTVKAFVERNSDVLSAAMRTADGVIIVQAGHHSKHWTHVTDTSSTPTHVKVPVFQADKRWGSVEVSFAPHGPQGLWGMLKDSVYGLALFVAVSGFVGYIFILRRALRELDPASVIPERVKVAFDTLTEGVLILDEKEQIVLANRAFAEKIGRPVSSLIGHKAAEFNWSSPEGKLQTQELPWIKALKQGHTQTGIPLSLKLRDKETRIFSVNGSPILDNQGLKRGVLATFDDITELERKNTELSETVTKLRDSECEVRLRVEELHRLATRDPLTGCFNRRSFFDAFESLLLEAKRDKLELSCIMADIDHFKSINDTHGHAVGDEAIKFMVEILRSTSRSHDIVGRYGGEEFCILLPGLNSEEASAVAERIRIALQRESAIRFALALSFTASFGVSTLSDGAQSPKELIEKADQALYHAKKCGRNRVIRWPIDQDFEQAGDTAVDRDARGRCLAPNVVATKDQGNTDVLPLHLDEFGSLPTGLLFYDRVVYAIAHGQRYNKVSAFLSLQIEPKHPSIVDEEICKLASTRLTAILRRTDVVANLGMEKSPPMISRSRANEFGILLTELDHTDSVTWVVKRILDKLSEPVSLSGDSLYLTTSIGISVYPHDGETPEALIENAQAARERATSMGARTRYQFFSPENNERARKWMRMEDQLCRAIDNDELELLYQPKVHIATRRITGFEALVRWDHPQRGPLSPDEFIPLAENTGLIAPLGKWVLHTACRQAKEWLTHFPDVRVAVNLSAVQFHHANICREVQGTLETAGLDPRHLELEITESAIMRDADKAALTLRDLAKLGVKITIDDFGTGYSSLSYLRAFPVDSFKIDRSFLKDLLTDVRAKALYTAIAAMAKSLGLQVVAEGVETQEQLDFVRQVQCDEVQGYLISEPIPGNDATKLLMQHISGLHIRFTPRRSSIGQTRGSLESLA